MRPVFSHLMGLARLVFTVTISPAFSYTSTTNAANASSHTANVSSGVPTAYAWSLVDGPGTIQSGATSATASLRVVGTAGESAAAVFQCAVTVNGVTKSKQITKTHFWETGGGGAQ